MHGGYIGQVFVHCNNFVAMQHKRAGRALTTRAEFAFLHALAGGPCGGELLLTKR